MEKEQISLNCYTRAIKLMDHYLSHHNDPNTPKFDSMRYHPIYKRLRKLKICPFQLQLKRLTLVQNIYKDYYQVDALCRKLLKKYPNNGELKRRLQAAIKMKGW